MNRKDDRLEQHVKSVAFSPDGKRIATSLMFDLKISDADNGTEIFFGDLNALHLGNVVFSPDGKCIAVPSSKSLIRIIDADKGTKIMDFEGSKSPILSMAMDREGKRIVSGCSDGTVIVWGVATGKEFFRLKGENGHNEEVRCVAFSPDGKIIASGSTDRSAKLWDVEKKSLMHSLTGHNGFVHSLAFSPTGQFLATGDGDGRFFVWDLRKRSGESSRCHLNKTRPANAVARRGLSRR